MSSRLGLGQRFASWFMCVAGVVCSASGAGVDQPPVELIGIDHVWSYNNSGADLGTEWRGRDYVDSAWPTGRAALGFPQNENIPLTTIQTVLNRFITGSSGPQVLTYYFRGRFTLEGSPQGVMLVTSNLVDDGAVFYLNGVEVGRVAMPNVAINATTLAARANDIGGARIDILEVSAESLVEGENVLAVEVHQVSLTSSDIIFGAELTMDPVPSVVLTWPVLVEMTLLHIERAGERSVRLTWDDSEGGFVLHQSNNADGPWFPINGAVSGVERSLLGPGRFFQLILGE